MQWIINNYKPVYQSTAWLAIQVLRGQVVLQLIQVIKFNLKCVIAKLMINHDYFGKFDTPQPTKIVLFLNMKVYDTCYCFLTWPATNVAMNKSISNELDITFHMLAPQFSGHCDVINNRLWRHLQIINRASETRGRCMKIVVFVVSFGFVISCKK